MAAGAPRKEELLTFCKETGALLRHKTLIGYRHLAGAECPYSDPSGKASEDNKGKCKEKTCGSSVHGRVTFYSHYVVPIDFVSGEPVEREGTPTHRFRGQVVYFTNADVTERRSSSAILVIDNYEIAAMSDGKKRFEPVWD